MELYSYHLFKKNKKQKGVFLLFFSFLFVKKNKMHDPGSDWWEEEEEAGGWEEEEDGVGGEEGLAGTIKNTARTIPLFTLLFPFIWLLPLPSPTFSFLYLIAYPINIPFPRCS